jgi:hypothetical protein
MANHKNYRRKIVRDSRFMDDDSYHQSPGDSEVWKKSHLNRHARRLAQKVLIRDQDDELLCPYPHNPWWA